MTQQYEEFQALRREYIQKPFTEEETASCPFEQFKKWFTLATDKVVDLPNAMTIATVSAGGQPSARVVLLKYYDDKGFVFFTNYGSQKGADLLRNPRISALFYWSLFDRQIRIAGEVEKVSREDSVAYFKSRPLDSQISAAISPQSDVVPHRQYLEEAFAKMKENTQSEDDVVFPDNWGGYRILPHHFEFWQGRENRLHDRLTYTKEDNQWNLQRLAP